MDVILPGQLKFAKAYQQDTLENLAEGIARKLPNATSADIHDQQPADIIYGELTHPELAQRASKLIALAKQVLLLAVPPEDLEVVEGLLRKHFQHVQQRGDSILQATRAQIAPSSGDGHREGDMRVNNAGHQEVLRGGRWHLATETGPPRLFDKSPNRPRDDREPLRYDEEFESKHPRDEQGQFRPSARFTGAASQMRSREAQPMSVSLSADGTINYHTGHAADAPLAHLAHAHQGTLVRHKPNGASMLGKKDIQDANQHNINSLVISSPVLKDILVAHSPTGKWPESMMHGSLEEHDESLRKHGITVERHHIDHTDSILNRHRQGYHPQPTKPQPARPAREAIPGPSRHEPIKPRGESGALPREHIDIRQTPHPPNIGGTKKGVPAYTGWERQRSLPESSGEQRVGLEPPSQVDWSAPKPAPKGLKPTSKRNRAIIDEIESLNPDPDVVADMQQDFGRVLDSVHSEHMAGIAMRNMQRNELLGQFGFSGHDIIENIDTKTGEKKPRKVSRSASFINAIRQYPDADAFMKRSEFGRKFDQMVQTVKDNPEQYSTLIHDNLGGGAAEELDIENALFERLQGGAIEKPLPQHHEDILSQAREIMFRDYDPESDVVFPWETEEEEVFRKDEEPLRYDTQRSLFDQPKGIPNLLTDEPKEGDTRTVQTEEGPHTHVLRGGRWRLLDQPQTAPQAPAQTRNEDLAAKAKQGDRDAQTKLITQNQGLVKSIAAKWSGRDRNLFEDLVQIGNIALLESAVGRASGTVYDPSLNVPFATYAAYNIKTDIRNAATRERKRGVTQTSEVTWEGEREDEPARDLGVSRETNPAEEAGTSEITQKMTDAIEFLPERHQQALTLYYGLSGQEPVGNLEQLGEQLGGVSPQRASVILNKAKAGLEGMLTLLGVKTKDMFAKGQDSIDTLLRNWAA